MLSRGGEEDKIGVIGQGTRIKSSALLHVLQAYLVACLSPSNNSTLNMSKKSITYTLY